MSSGPGSEPVADDEIVYRRVSVESGWYDPTLDKPVNWVAFRPNKNDKKGISVWRAEYKSPVEVAQEFSRAEHSYFVLELYVCDLRQAGVKVIATPEDGGPGHASLSNLSTEDYALNRDMVKNLATHVAENLIKEVHGPYGPF